jgi:2-hydroxychromene-2-carboxylate isomerase
MREDREFLRLLFVVFCGMWVDRLDLNQDDTVRTMLSGAGFDPDRCHALATDPAVKAKLLETTDEAISRGVFGAPTMFVGDQMFFGQDRLDFVAEALS